MIRVKLILVFLLCIASQSNGQMGKVDTKHISDRSFFVVRIDVERILGHLKKSKKDLDRLAKEMENEIRLDIKQVKVMTLQFGDSDVEDGTPSFSVTIELAKDVDQDAFVQSISGGFETFTEASMNGKKYLKPESKRGPHLYFESKRKFTAATAGAMESILNDGSGMRQMASRVKSTPPGAEVAAIFQRSKDFDASVEQVAENLDFPGLPFDFDKLLETGESGMAYLNLSSESPIFVQVQFDTVEAAKSAKTGIDELVALGKASVPLAKVFVNSQLKDVKGEGRFEEMERNALQLGLDGLNVSEKILGALKLEHKGKAIELSVRQMGGLTEIADLMAGGLSLTFLGVAGPPAAAIEDAKELRKIER